MTAIIPFQFDSNPIRVVADESGEPLFVGKDLCEALGYKDTTNAMKQHCKGVVKHHPLQTQGGKQDVRVLTEADMFRLIVSSTLPAAERFEAWVFEELLPTVRKTGSYTAPGAKAPPAGGAKMLDAFKLTPLVVRAARALGLDKNAAAISANQAVAKLTGTNVLRLLGHEHLQAEQQALVFTPSELGEQMGGVSGRRVNMLLAEAGLQAKRGEHWAPLPAAEGFYRVLDTGKRHGDGTMIQQIKWVQNVLALLQRPGADVSPAAA